VWRAAFRLAAGELRARRRFQPIATDPPVADELGAVEILGVLESLPGNQRAAAVLHWYAGFDTREVADILGIARGTVRVHLSRARHRLATFLDEEVDR
jgi:RNA polymerase sigma-70 factor (ECF subfamily)